MSTSVCGEGRAGLDRLVCFTKSSPTPARGGRRHCNQARQLQFPRDRDHGISQERRHAGKGRRDGKPRSTRTTQLYDRRRDELNLDEIERIVI